MRKHHVHIRGTTLAALVAVQGFMAGLLPETLSYAGSEMRFGTFGQAVVFGAVELSALPALPPFPTAYQTIDPYFWGPLEGQVNSWFDSNIK